ncbi:glycosyltransferase family 4 protein [Thermopolyspora sp. NPDC052614]|uniref:glycosyltransferase family 4 protein n=1 Tax=Thermopolyspora sp. NPDC052614 TaxID=3155682 RepID=UPI0034452913
MLKRGRTAVARAALALLHFVNRRRGRNAPPPDDRTVRLLLLHAHGMGGTIRTVINLAGHLARDRDVEIVSLVRESAAPFFPIPPGVRMTFLDDRLAPRGRIARMLSRRPSRLMPKQEKAYHRFTLWSDLLLIRYLRSLRSGVLITTRPGFNLAAALFAPPGVILIGQEHVTLDSHDPELVKLIKRRYGRLDALVTLTQADLRHYRRELKAAPPHRLVRIPNAIAPLAGDVSRLEEKTVVAIGRIVRAKGFDRLVKAWQRVAAAHPDWTLRIFGGGTPENEAKLRARIAEAGLEGKIILMGSTPEVGVELAKSSIYVVSSRYEGFGMTILEAMSKGVPVVSFDCPHGPREIITHGHDGLLVRSTKTAALAGAICRLIEDEPLRRELGRNGLRTASAYDMGEIGPQWDRLLAELVAARDGDQVSAPVLVDSSA